MPDILPARRVSTPVRFHPEDISSACPTGLNRELSACLSQLRDAVRQGFGIENLWAGTESIELDLAMQVHAERKMTMGQKEELLKLMPNVLNAPDYVAKGGDFDKVQLHVTAALGKVGDPEGWKATVETLEKYRAQALAYYYLHNVLSIARQVQARR
jgi:hypothetical protein